MNWLQTIHPVTVVVMALGSLLGTSLMLAVFDLKLVSQTAACELMESEIRERTLTAKPLMERRFLDQA